MVRPEKGSGDLLRDTGQRFATSGIPQAHGHDAAIKMHEDLADNHHLGRYLDRTSVALDWFACLFLGTGDVGCGNYEISGDPGVGRKVEIIYFELPVCPVGFGVI